MNEEEIVKYARELMNRHNKTVEDFIEQALRETTSEEDIVDACNLFDSSYEELVEHLKAKAKEREGVLVKSKTN